MVVLVGINRSRNDTMVISRFELLLTKKKIEPFLPFDTFLFSMCLCLKKRWTYSIKNLDELYEMLAGYIALHEGFGLL